MAMQIEWDQPYAEIHGGEHGGCLEQGGQLFDRQGNAVGGKRRPASKTPPTVKAASAKVTAKSKPADDQVTAALSE